MVLDEPIHIVMYDPAWPRIAEAEIDRLHRELGEYLVACEHFGSTSVPGCDAKPSIDLLVGLGTWPALASVRMKLSVIGYEDWGEAGIPGRLYFTARGPQSFNLAVTLQGSDLWRANVQIRELLRSDSDLVRQYVDVKHVAVREGCTTLLAYSHRKADFMSELRRRATRG